jgi:hypothetical protein
MKMKKSSRRRGWIRKMKMKNKKCRGRRRMMKRRRWIRNDNKTISKNKKNREQRRLGRK